MIRYVVDVGATHRHSFSVELRIERPDAAQRLSLPAWIPGSYLVREFARHLSGLTAEQGGAALPLEQLDKATWLARCAAGVPLVVRYQVYAFDTSVRAAFLDALARLLQRHRRLPARRGQGRRAARPRAARPAGRLGRRDDARAAARRRRARVRRRRLRRARRPPGRARPVLARPLRCGRRAARVRRRRRLARLRRRAAARRHEAPVRGRDRVLARQRAGAVRSLPVHAQRARGRPRRPRAPLEHGAGGAAARPAAARPATSRARRRRRRPRRATATSACSA